MPHAGDQHSEPHLVALSLREEIALWVVVAAILSRAALPQVEGEGEHRPGQGQATGAAQVVLSTDEGRNGMGRSGGL